MKKNEELNGWRNTKVTYDPTLEKLKGQVLFPEKLALANERLKNAKLPKKINSCKVEWLSLASKLR